MIRRLTIIFAALFILVSASLAQKKSIAKSDKKAGDAAVGQKIFKEKCSVCHYSDKEEKRIGPGLKGVFKREKMFDDRPMNEANVREMIKKGGGKMVGFEETLSEKEIDGVVAFLKTL
jgi:cytochrome c